MNRLSSTLCRGRTFTVSGENPADGVATVNWLLDHGAQVTVVRASAPAEIQKRVHEHIKRVARDGDEYAKMLERLSFSNRKADAGTDETELFLSAWKRPLIGITGAFGKTTTAVWAAHLIGDAVVAGHIPGRPLLPALDSRARVAVIKVNGSIPKSRIPHLISTDTLSSRDAAVEAARMVHVPEGLIQQRLATLPHVPFRQEVVYRSPKLTVINDAFSSYPENCIVALERWGGPTSVLICGGDDARFDYHRWADVVLKHIRRTNLILLSGSATKKMRSALGAYGRGIRSYDSLAAAFSVARDRAGLYVSSVILFSPAAQSGSLFSDQYERGQQLNSLVKRHC